jgi:predicted DNA binding CopG/RHH family protein
MKKKISVNTISDKDFQEIMGGVIAKKNVPLIKSEQVNMRLSPSVILMAKKLALKAGKPLTTFLSQLLIEDLERLWKVAK